MDQFKNYVYLLAESVSGEDLPKQQSAWKGTAASGIVWHEPVPDWVFENGGRIKWTDA